MSVATSIMRAQETLRIRRLLARAHVGNARQEERILIARASSPCSPWGLNKYVEPLIFAQHLDVDGLNDILYCSNSKSKLDWRHWIDYLIWVFLWCVCDTRVGPRDVFKALYMSHYVIKYQFGGGSCRSRNKLSSKVKTWICCLYILMYPSLRRVDFVSLWSSSRPNA